MKIIKSIEHLSLRNCNKAKLKKLEAVATAYHSYLQKVVDYYWENNLIPSKYVANLNFSGKFDTATPADTSLSKRYQQTCGLQAIAGIKSYWSKIQDEVKNRISSEIKEGNRKPKLGLSARRVYRNPSVNEVNHKTKSLVSEANIFANSSLSLFRASLRRLFTVLKGMSNRRLMRINFSLRINSRLKAEVATLLAQWQRRLNTRVFQLANAG